MGGFIILMRFGKDIRTLTYVISLLKNEILFTLYLR